MKTDLKSCRLYGILDLAYVEERRVPAIAESMIQGGVDIIQLRGKTRSIKDLAIIAAALHQITSQNSIPLIVNDYPEIAIDLPVEGVHVGQDDDSISLAREKSARNLWVGKSTHSLKQAVAAERQGADYIGFGPIFATPTKPDYQPIGLKDINRAHSDVSIPIFCIGGIKLDNLEQVIAAGARRVAIVSGLLKAPDILQYAQACKSLLKF